MKVRLPKYYIDRDVDIDLEDLANKMKEDEVFAAKIFQVTLGRPVLDGVDPGCIEYFEHTNNVVKETETLYKAGEFDLSDLKAISTNQFLMDKFPNRKETN